MKPADKRVLTRNLPYLTENTGTIPMVLNMLLSEGKLNSIEIQEINAKQTSYSKATEMYTILMTKDDETFGVLLKVLKETGNDHLAAKLTESQRTMSITEVPSTPTFKNSLEKNYLYLADHLGDHTSLNIHLLHHKIITDAESEKIFHANKGKIEINADLLKLLKGKDWSLIEATVIQIFQATGNEHCAKKLRGEF